MVTNTNKQMQTYEFISQSVQDTDRLGGLIAGVLKPGDVIGLQGALGAGKTRLVQAIAATLGTPPDGVTSPTFVLLNEYESDSLPIYHLDVYRLKDEDEFLELGPEEYFDGSGVTFVEWSDRVSELLPARITLIQIEIQEHEARRFLVSGELARRM